MKKLFFMFSTAILLQGCASTLKMEPQALDGQQEIFQEGIESVISAKESLVAVRSSSKTYSSEHRPTFVISVLNGTDTPFNFSTEDVKVYVDEIPHKVFTYDELVAEVKRKQAWAAVAAALNGVSRSMNAANAGYTYQSGTANAYAYNNYGGSAYGTSTYSGYSYNAAAAQQAQASANAQNQAEFKAVQTQTEDSLNALSATILKKTTVMPQARHGGYITIEKLDDINVNHELKVIVTVSGEEHEFLFNHYKLQK